ncbi:hypothetical protein TNCT_26361 [Trichonephila clavata]|uniref:Uncharacterized protein n=1 Tax=Trichonephila clavata TaxID=2740835 RepID=A0A8X6L007_TRICU|nr:hypothetical protein TNCT_26361 [Trichonephila clavata]
MEKNLSKRFAQNVDKTSKFLCVRHRCSEEEALRMCELKLRNDKEPVHCERFIIENGESRAESILRRNFFMGLWEWLWVMVLYGVRMPKTNEELKVRNCDALASVTS